MAQDNGIRVGLIGIGHVARHQIAALDDVEGMALRGAFDLDPAAARLLPAGVPFHGSLESYIADAGVDVTLVSTPPATHREIAARLIEAGMPVVVEKPACLDPAEFSALVEAARRGGVFCHVAFHAAFARDLRWWLAERDAMRQATGALVGFHCGFYDPYVTDGRLDAKAARLGGSWFDSGINALSVIATLLEIGEVSLAQARMTSLPQIPCPAIQGVATFTFPGPNGRGLGVIDTNWTTGLNHKTTRLYYERAEILLEHSREAVTLTVSGQPARTVELGTGVPRLTSHYVLLFEDLMARFRANDGNLSRSTGVHELLFAANDDGRVPDGPQ